MLVPDTSVLVAGADRNHRFFTPAAASLAVVRSEGRLVAHTIAECVSVLTRLGVLAIGPAITYVDQFLSRKPIGVPRGGYRDAIAELGAGGISHGAIFDGLIAIAVRDAGDELVSLDRRAERTYQIVGAAYRILEP